MTTIVYDGRYLAADSLVSEGGIIYGYRKKISTKHFDGLEVVIGFSGEIAAASAFNLRFTETYPLAPESEFLGSAEYSAIAVYRDGSVETYTHRCRSPENVKAQNYALGSGAAIAQGALACGKNAIEAVRIACAIDLCSGGEIVVFDTDAWVFI